MEKNNKEKNKLYKNGFIRPDYLFSYWILIWAIMYFFAQRAKETTASKFICENMNPMIALVFALLENIFMFIKILIYNPVPSLIVNFLFMMFFVKIIPIYLIRSYKIKIIENITTFIFIFIVYIIYLFSNKTSVYDVYIEVEKSIFGNENKTPMFPLIEYIKSIFKKLFYV